MKPAPVPFSRYLLYGASVATAMLVLVSCQSTSSSTAKPSAFIPDAVINRSAAQMSDAEFNQKKELEGYVAGASGRRLMRLPKDLNLNLAGALKKSTKVEFQEVETYPQHVPTYRLPDYTNAVDFNSRLGPSYYKPGVY